LHFAFNLMATVISSQSIVETTRPKTAADVASLVRSAYEAGEAIYPIGGGTALDYGTEPGRPGRNLELAGLNRVVDYTPRDMTIVVEAGVRMGDLVATLAAEGQHLPIDVPRASEATIGGVVATNWNGPRRYGYGTIRDYVIGIDAVDGRGTAFKGGGRVVKNVAGYDFCKLLTGSLGTLAVITQVALKVKPQTESTATVVGECADLTVADAALDRLAMLETPPMAIDLLVGSGWTEASAKIQIAVRLEGTQQEVKWLTSEVEREFAAAGCSASHALNESQAAELWKRQVEFADRGVADVDKSPMVLKISVPASAVTGIVGQLLEADPNCGIQAHAGNGIIVARFEKFGQTEISSLLVAKLRPAAVRLGGSLVVLRTTLSGLTPHLIWGGRDDATVLLEQVKRQFDPKGIMNPGRFVF
jgi:glycolate oxidase FAD binding subunit